MEQQGESEDSNRASNSGPTFLNASNPDQVKRNVLAGFKDVLMLPVTIVPRTVTFGVNAIVSGGSHAVNGLSMLNPQKWAGSAGSNGAQLIKDKDGDVIFDVPTIDDEKDSLELDLDEKRGSVGSINLAPPTTSSTATPTAITPATPTSSQSYDKLQLLVSLDVALELIHADRDALKRTETFASYPGKYGHRVRETIEEIFILMLKAAADRHIAPGFRMYVSSTAKNGAELIVVRRTR
jgi:recyclin-1